MVLWISLFACTARDVLLVPVLQVDFHEQMIQDGGIRGLDLCLRFILPP